MQQTFIDSVLRFRWLVVIAAVLLVAVAGKGLERIVVLSDYKSFIDPEYPGLVELEQIEDIFSENHNLLIAVAPKDGVVFKPKTIELLQQVTDKAWLLPHASRVDSITNYQHTEADGDDLVVGDLLPEGEPLTDELLERARRVSATEPTLLHNLISEDLEVAVVSVTFSIPDDVGPSKANDDIITALNTMIDDYSASHPETAFYVTGMITVDYSLSKYGKQDNATLIPGMLLLMVAILWVMTRSFSGVFSASLVVIFTGLGAMGLLGWGYWKIDPGSAIAPIVIMTLAVADSVHVIEAMQKAMRDGMNKLDAIRQSLKDNFMPIFLTSLTTVMGVFTFTFAELPSLRRIGLSVALGVTIAFVLSVTLLPALLSLLPMKVKPARKGTNLFNRIAEFSIAHYKPVVIVGLGLSAILIALVPQNRFNDSPSAMLAPYTPERQAVEFYEENVSGVLKLDVAVFTDEPGGINDPAFLTTIEEFSSWMLARPNIDHITTLTDTFKRLNRTLHGDDPAWYRLPEEQDMAAQYLLLYEMSLPYGLDLNNQIDIDKSGLLLTAIMGKGDSQIVVETGRAIDQWFADNAPQLRVVVTGTTPLTAELSYVKMIPSMMKGGIIAILMVSFVLFLSLRSWKLGIVAMLANILPVGMGYGLWYLLNGQVNFAVASVAGVCLGVVVDFAVHFLSKYRRAHYAGESTEDAIRFAFAKTGRPLWTTMVVLVSGFWLLMLSPVTLNFSMGALTGIIILLALVFDFLVLPGLLMLLDRKPVTKPAHDLPEQAAATGR
ncbi:MAG: RND transporter [Porticoccaceae bacterium]|nr:RND transporter [Porticoccaceae bacterium]